MRKHTGKFGSRSLAFKEMRNINLPWRSVLHLGRRAEYRKGHHVHVNLALHFLDRGSVRLTHWSLDGVEKILWYIEEGCLFGEVPCFDPLPAENLFVCAKHCVIYIFSRECVDNIARTRPDLLINLLQSMACKMRHMAHHASALYLDTALVRLCKFLAHRLEPGSDPPLARIDLSQREISCLLGMNRISLYRILRQQEENGMLGPVEGNKITILKPDEFFRLAECQSR
ncbi:MAG: Crp/Fnr family transcriptional regulator [Desulfovibrio sp.]|jgi:CRP-like cAMP-binding protein|nr:Crp/Fnr family transcriptional regulator [Desulfovibrio sp.]